MNCKIEKATRNDEEFIFDLAQNLSKKEIFQLNESPSFFTFILELDTTDLFVITCDEEKCGYALLNKTPMLRYLGFCLEIEEIVVSSKFRGKGIGAKFISLLKDHYKVDSRVRKLSIKTNDVDGSARLYGRVFRKTDMIYFQEYLNTI